MLEQDYVLCIINLGNSHWTLLVLAYYFGYPVNSESINTIHTCVPIILGVDIRGEKLTILIPTRVTSSVLEEHKVSYHIKHITIVT